MGLGIFIALALCAIAEVAVIVCLAVLAVKKLKELIKSRLEKKKKSTVAFGSTRKIVNKHAKEILAQAPSMTMAELEEIVEDRPYFIVDYDPETDTESDLTIIQAETVEDRVEELFYENDGIVLFD